MAAESESILSRLPSGGKQIRSHDASCSGPRSFRATELARRVDPRPLDAMPAQVVTAAESGATFSDMLKGVPFPAGLQVAADIPIDI